MTKKRPNEHYVAYLIDPDGVRHDYHRKTYERHWNAPAFAILYPRDPDRHYKNPGLEPSPPWGVRKWTHTFWKAEEYLQHYCDHYPGSYIVPVFLEKRTRASKYFQNKNGRDMIIL